MCGAQGGAPPMVEEEAEVTDCEDHQTCGLPWGGVLGEGCKVKLTPERTSSDTRVPSRVNKRMRPLGGHRDFNCQPVGLSGS